MSEMTDEQIKTEIRNAGGIVHSDGNIFFTSSEKMMAAARALLDAKPNVELLQDDCRGLSKWLAEKPDALRVFREQASATGEPVAWMTEDGRVAMAATKNSAMHRITADSYSIPLFTAPSQPAVPLTGEQLRPQVQRQHAAPLGRLLGDVVGFVRDVEAAHGISAPTPKAQT